MRMPEPAAMSPATALGIRTAVKGLREFPQSLQKIRPVVLMLRWQVPTHTFQYSAYRYELSVSPGDFGLDISTFGNWRWPSAAPLGFKIPMACSKVSQINSNFGYLNHLEMIVIASLRALFEKGETLACDVSLPSFFSNHGVQTILRLEKSVGERDQRSGLKIAFYEVAPADS